MGENTNFNCHFLATAMLFVLGNTVITAPTKTADSYNFLGFLSAGVLAVLCSFLVYLLPFNKFLATVWSLLAVYFTGETFVVFIEFIKNNLLPETAPVMIAFPFIALIIYLSLKPLSVLFKFSLISAVVAMFIILLFFLSTAKDFEYRNIFIYSLPQKTKFLRQLLPYIKSIVLPVVLLSVFAKISEFGKGVLLSGFGIGFLSLALTILNSVLLFGMEFSGYLNYPYSSVGSTATFGNLFTRLDGFIYFLYLSSCLIRCVVLIDIIKKSRRLLSP